MGNCGSSNEVAEATPVPAATKQPSRAPSARGGLEPTTPLAQQSEKAPSRAQSPRVASAASKKEPAAQSSDDTVKVSSRAPSAEPLWLSPAAQPAELTEENHNA